MPSGTPAQHRHATPKPTVAERPHGHKEAPPQVIPMTNTMPGDSPFVTLDQFQSAMSAIRTVIMGTVESRATLPIQPEDGSTMPRIHGTGIMCAVATSPNAIPASLDWRNQPLSTAEGTNTSNGHAEGTQPLLETRWESGSASFLSEEALGTTTASSRKSAEATEDSYRPDADALTITPDFPLPPIQTILEMLGGAKYFSTLDLEAGFHQIRMAKEDRWKTAFRSVLGFFEYRVMAFDLKGPPAMFQANINAYLQRLLGEGVIAYIDDVLIYSSDISGHVSLL
ncbi:hypothetical protein ENH_00050500 [Eimeria necatrix]|uniref:Reverse transcriptase domain-containing protein n=1 Tax=Eimeria necatrix TaxID=51315 RepID=U6N0I5_9EIME|nr:hypothetical protein ENH_00050500 [Eimeria necatrix]CDJ68259.1 hypothetical protein ENH_00050500 [Eimeria necatrix]